MKPDAVLPARSRARAAARRAVPFTVASLLLAAVTACAGAPSPPPPPPEPAIPDFQFSHTTVWTARPDVALRVDSLTTLAVARPFSRLQVLDADPDGVTVRCIACRGSAVEGRVGWEDLIFEPDTPVSAAHGSITEFALAVRQAAENRDVEALRLVMARDFTYAHIGPQGREIALAAWESEGWRSLAMVPLLLDRGLATRNGSLWAAPGEHLEELGYQGYRLGFRGSPDGRWEWTFLVQDDR
jgi:hypothetical protein